MLFVQGFGSDDEVIDGHDLAGYTPLQFPQVTVAGEHDVIGLDRAVIGLHAVRAAFGISFDDGRLVQSCAGLDGRVGEAERVIERVQMTCAHVEAATIIGIATDQFSHFIAFEVADLLVLVVFAQVVDVSTRIVGIGGFMVGVCDSRFQVTVDAVPGD